MKPNLYPSLLIAFALSAVVGCGDKSEPTQEPNQAGSSGAAESEAGGLQTLWEWTFYPGTFVYTEESDDDITTETITLTDSHRMTFIVDNPGDDADKESSGSWEQIHDGVRLQYSRVDGVRTEGQDFYKYEESLDSIVDKNNEGKTYTRTEAPVMTDTEDE